MLKNKNTNNSIYLNKLSIKDKEAILKNKTCVIYARVSSSSQLEGMSLETQTSMAKAYAKKRKMKLGQIYQEDVSARIPQKRKQFEQMLKDSDANVIIFAMTDRLSRNAVDLHHLLEKVEKEGLILVILKENLILQHPVSANEKLILDMVMGVSSYQVNHNRDVCLMGIHKKALSGHRPCKPPYGYRNSPKNHKTLISKNEAELVKEAFEYYATGRYSLKELPELLYQNGFRYKLRPSKIIPKASLASILKNRFYTGKYTFKGIEGVMQGTHKPIISEELFEKVQGVLNPNDIQPVRHSHTFSKLILCKHCGTYMVGDKKIKPSGREYTYYRCCNPKCTFSVNANQIIIEEALESYFKEIRLKQIPQKLIDEVLKDSLSDLRDQKTSLKLKANHKYQKVQKHLEWMAENDINDIEYSNEKLDEIQDEYGDIDTQIEVIEGQISSIKSKTNDVFQLRLYDIYKTLPDASKRKIIELMKNNFTIDTNKKVKMTFKAPFREIRSRYKV